MFSLLLNVPTYISLLCSAPSKHSFLLFCHHFLTILIFFKKITNRSFRFASPHLWNQHQLPVPLRQPTIISLLHIHRISLTAVHVRHHHGISTLLNSFSFHSRLKTYLFTSLSHRRLLVPYPWTAFSDLNRFSDYPMLIGGFIFLIIISDPVW